MFLNLKQHQSDYRDRGFTVLPVIPEDLASAWACAILSAIDGGRGHRVDSKDERGEVKDGIGGRLYYDLVDGVQCEQIVPNMLAVYESMPALISAVSGEDVVLSPYPRSKVCGKRYPAGGGEQGWHFDTNGITVLIYLTTNQDGHTVLCPLNDPLEVRITPKSGSVLVMQGRKVWHRGSRVKTEDKVISPWNYYVAGDTWRPEGLDDMIYGPATA